LLQDEQTSKHGGGGRYNAILEFKGEQINKNLMRKKNNEKKEIKKNICMRKKEKKKMSMYDIKIK
jgi:hypothetical protein